MTTDEHRASPRLAGEQSAGSVTRGFVAALPLWPGVIPFAVAFTIAARATGFSAVETQLLSLTVFAGAAQITVVSMAASGAAALSITFTAILLNLRHLLYGMVLRRMMVPDERPRPEISGSMLTDEGFGLTIRHAREGRGISGFMLGSGLSLYVVWNLSTLTGLMFGAMLPDPERIGLAFIFPLTFIALLRPLMRGRIAFVTAAAAALLMLALSSFVSSGIALPVAICAAALLGTILETRADR
ncbi:MAG: AzlC family ABC transporter permease [Thermomicrobiales bacterium]